MHVARVSATESAKARDVHDVARLDRADRDFEKISRDATHREWRDPRVRPPPPLSNRHSLTPNPPTQTNTALFRRSQGPHLRSLARGPQRGTFPIRRARQMKSSWKPYTATLGLMVFSAARALRVCDSGDIGCLFRLRFKHDRVLFVSVATSGTRLDTLDTTKESRYARQEQGQDVVPPEGDRRARLV